MIITKYYHISIRVLHLITKLMSAIFKAKEREWSGWNIQSFDIPEKPWMSSVQDIQT